MKLKIISSALLVMAASKHGFAQSSSPISFGCDNPPITSSEHCATIGVKIYENAGCTLTELPAATTCKPTTKANGQWECKIESSNCADHTPNVKGEDCPKGFGSIAIVGHHPNVNVSKVLCQKTGPEPESEANKKRFQLPKYNYHR